MKGFAHLVHFVRKSALPSSRKATMDKPQSYEALAKQVRTNCTQVRKSFVVLLAFFSLLAPAVLLPATAGAVNVFQACNTYDGSNGGASAQGSSVCNSKKSSGTNPVITILKDVLEIISLIVGFAAVAMLIVGGFKFVTSGGDPSGIKSARETVLYALIGVVVVAFSQVVVAFVLNKLK